MQESLTNVLKHSGATRASVGVTYVDDGVDIEVRDAGTGTRARTRRGSCSERARPGRACDERTRLLGGVLEYGAVDGTGFRVAAHLPSSKPVAS